MCKQFSILTLFALTFALLGGTVNASSITEDLADCAQGVAIDSLLKAKMALKAAEFAAYHSDCIPLVTAVDPVLVGMTGGILALQANNSLARDADVCIEQIFNVAQKPIAGMIDTTMSQPGLSSIVPAASRSMLHDIAMGYSNEALYSVPGMTIITSKLTCGCAVAEAGVPVEALKETVENGLKTINSCSGVVTKLLGGAYTLAASGAEAVLASVTEIYNTAQNAIKSLGCGWLWSCPSPPSGPPFFCTGYSLVRARGSTVDAIRSQYDDLWKMVNGGTQSGFSAFANQSESLAFGAQQKAPPPNPYNAMIDTCEKQFVDEVDRINKDIALANAAVKAEAEGSNYALAYAFRWWPECQGDPICRDGIGGISNLFYADIKDPDIRAYYGKNSPNPFVATVKGLNEKYRPNAQIVVWGARDRRYQALRDNPAAPPKDRLIAYGCNPFLGRERQSLCTSTNNMAVCKQYVNEGRWNFCVSSLAPASNFSAGRALRNFVQTGGCVPLLTDAQRATTTLHSVARADGNQQLVNGLALLVRENTISTTQIQRFQCLSPSAWRTCKSFQNGGSLVDCGPARTLTLTVSRPITTTPVASLENLGGVQGVTGLAPTSPPAILAPALPGLRRRPPQQTIPPLTPTPTPLGNVPFQTAPPDASTPIRPLPALKRRPTG